MHQRHSGEDIVAFATRFDAKQPDSLRWADMTPVSGRRASPSFGISNGEAGSRQERASCERLVQYGAEEADRLGHSCRGPQHLMLGLLREKRRPVT